MKKLIKLLKVKWYTVLLTVAAFLVLIEILGPWIFAPVFMAGFIVWGYKRVNK